MAVKATMTADHALTFAIRLLGRIGRMWANDPGCSCGNCDMCAYEYLVEHKSELVAGPEILEACGRAVGKAVGTKTEGE